ncbi:MAG: response regulator transcription factor [Pseudotabrizicola sp.]|uniref:response regulator n=1 Tax=Pseudotabrizicola sp. TaxID=2939647 RepID=UPI0027164ADD|nr:response regulator transcription factor [Pseudotabrizicola sp.]MDO9640619.1 response regulator transcription factor [Pseudotabrizicola sp.]
MKEHLSILIGDDHELIRDAVAHLLRSEPEFSVHVAKDASSVLSEIRRAGKFDIVLLDVLMPGMKGLDTVKDMVSANSGGAVVIFSGQVDSDFVWAAVELGAMGYIPKTMPLRALSSTLRVIATGQIFVPIMERPETKLELPGFNLTDREKSILRKLPKGMTNKEIARIENIPEVAVKMHMRAICAKLNAKNRTHAAILAQEMSIV